MSLDVLTDVELEAVAGYLGGAGAEVAGPLTAHAIAGGRSNLTVKLSDGSSYWVLRMPPRTGRTPSAHDVAREHRVTTALGDTDVPVPTAVALCEDEAVIGAPFAISSFVDGVAIQSREQLDALGDSELERITTRLLETLVALHRVDHVAVGLAGFGRPDGYAARQLNRWAGQWQLVGVDRWNVLALEVVGRLQADLPHQRSTGIVHGDFRIDNTLLRLHGEVEVRAVVDWELSTIGDPVADVAMMCAYRHPSFDRIVGGPSAWASPRLPAPSGLAAMYESAGGVDLVGWDFHMALAYFKIAVIAAGIDHRYRAGSGAGAGFDSAGEAVGPLLEAASGTLGERP